jgi:hypothetical protein
LRPIGEASVELTLPADVDVQAELLDVVLEVNDIGTRLSGFARFKDNLPLKSSLLHYKNKVNLLAANEADPSQVENLLTEINKALEKFKSFDSGSESTASISKTSDRKKQPPQVTTAIDFEQLRTDLKTMQQPLTTGTIPKDTTSKDTVDLNINSAVNDEEAVKCFEEIEKLGTEIIKLNRDKIRLKNRIKNNNQDLVESDDESSDNPVDKVTKIRDSLVLFVKHLKTQNGELEKQLKCSTDRNASFLNSRANSHGKSIPKSKLNRSKFENLSFQSDSETVDSEPDNNVSRRKSFSFRKSRKSEEKLAVSRWKVKFSGEGGTSLVDFFRQVDMYVESEEISEEKLVRKAGQLFSGAALEWFMSSKHRFKRWKHIVQGLREAFLPEDNDFYVLQQCERRQQQKSETFEVFWANMNKHFDSLTYDIPEQQKLKILKRNLKPSHRVGVALMDVKSIDELRVYCRRLDGLDPSLYGSHSETNNSNRQNRGQICELETGEGVKDDKEKGKEKKSKKKKSEQRIKTKEEEVVAEVQSKPQFQRTAQGNKNQFKPKKNQYNGPPVGQPNQGQWQNAPPNWQWPQQFGQPNPSSQMTQPSWPPQPNGASVGNFMDQWAIHLTGQPPQNQQIQPQFFQQPRPMGPESNYQNLVHPSSSHNNSNNSNKGWCAGIVTEKGMCTNTA